MSNWKQRYNHLRAKHGGKIRGLASGLKETGIDALGGLAAGAISDFVMPHLPSQVNSGWAEVAVMGVAGHLIRKKNNWLGDGFVGAAGYLAWKHLKESGVLGSLGGGGGGGKDTANASAPGGAAGFDNALVGAGWLDTPGNAGALMGGNNAGALMGGAAGIEDNALDG